MHKQAHSTREPEPSIYVRTTEVADMLEIDRTTLYRWIKNQRFPAPMELSPRCHVWRRIDVQSWLDAKLQTAK